MCNSTRENACVEIFSIQYNIRIMLQKQQQQLSTFFPWPKAPEGETMSEHCKAKTATLDIILTFQHISHPHNDPRSLTVILIFYRPSSQRSWQFNSSHYQNDPESSTHIINTTVRRVQLISHSHYCPEGSTHLPFTLLSGGFNSSPIHITVRGVQLISHPHYRLESSSHLPSTLLSGEFISSPIHTTVWRVHLISHPRYDSDSSTLVPSPVYVPDMYLSVFHYTLLSSIRSPPKSFSFTIICACLVSSRLVAHYYYHHHHHYVQSYIFVFLITKNNVLWNLIISDKWGSYINIFNLVFISAGSL
jgi:hypothetical protein